MMYLRARKLAELSLDVTSGGDNGEQRLEALVVAMNAMKLLNQQDAWILVPLPSGGAHVCSNTSWVIYGV